MFLYSQWRQLPLDIRNDIAKQFGISKSGPTHVDSNVIVSDGYKIEEVEAALNIDALQSFTGSDDTNMTVLWDLMVNRIMNPVAEPAVEVPAEEVPAEAPVVEEAPEPVIETPIVEPAVEKPTKKVTKKSK